MNTDETSLTDHAQTVRLALMPLFLSLALTALLVLALISYLAWTGERTARIVSVVLALGLLGLLASLGLQIKAVREKLAGLFVREVDGREEQLERLRRRHFLLSATLSGVGDAVIAADVGGRILLMNPVAEKLTGWQEADAVGREVGKVLTLTHEQTGKPLDDPAAAILAASVGLEFPSHAALTTRTGERGPISGSGTPIWEEGGKPGGVALVFRDISERRVASEAIHALETSRESSEARAAAILETALDGVVLINRQGNIVGFNPAAERVFGWSSAQARNKPAVDMLVPPALREQFRQDVRGRLSPGSPAGAGARSETLALHADGREVPVEQVITLIPRQDPPIFAVHLRDISDRHAAEAALRRAQEAALAAARAESREKSLFLANMSDELRTPLNAVIGYSEMLQEEAVDRELDDLVPDLKKIHGAGEHLLSLINDILDLSKIEAGQMELYPETFDVDDMLAEVAATIQSIVARNENSLRLNASPGLGAMTADRIKVKQSLLNLISNAAGFSHQRVIALDAKRERSAAGEWLVFRVADASADRDLPLHQQLSEAAPALETSNSPRFSGHGLALVIASRFCQMQGGEFTGSREPGHGAVYCLRFPVR